MGGWAHILQLLACEDVNGGEVTLGVSVLPCLGSGHVYNLRVLVLLEQILNIVLFQIAPNASRLRIEGTELLQHFATSSAKLEAQIATANTPELQT